VNGVAECRAPFGRRQLPSSETIGERLERVSGGYLRVPPLVDVRPDALNGRDPCIAARGFEAVEASAIDGLERKLVLKTSLGAGIELARRQDRALAIQVRAIALETQGSRGSRGFSGSSGSGGRMTRRFPLQSSPAASTQHLRAFAFQLPTWKANPLVLCELTVFLCHGSQSNRCL
jgi:hypothetical protein